MQTSGKLSKSCNTSAQDIPPEQLADLRKISGLLNLSKITDKILTEWIAPDIEDMRGKSQYGNQKNMSACSTLSDQYAP